MPCNLGSSWSLKKKTGHANHVLSTCHLQSIKPDWACGPAVVVFFFLTRSAKRDRYWAGKLERAEELNKPIYIRFGVAIVAREKTSNEKKTKDEGRRLWWRQRRFIYHRRHRRRAQLLWEMETDDFIDRPSPKKSLLHPYRSGCCVSNVVFPAFFLSVYFSTIRRRKSS